MENEKLIPVDQFCKHYNIEFSFINTLTEFGLIQITRIEEIPCIPYDQIKDLEKLIRLHYDLEINVEGIDAISHLLNRVDQLQMEMKLLKNRLRLYENEE
ncbi:MAG: chaperone modulator CbpM [Bacteroidia bacterium]|nr:chaperone modulator CbpM [Bacteroidia bacterium]